MTEPPRIDIGIDGGGTGCRVAVAMKGLVVEAEGGPANIVTDPASAEAAIRETLTRALDGAGLGWASLAEARICAGMAGGRLPGVADAFAMRLPWLVSVVDDSVTALEGALGGGDGALISLGTGSFFIARRGAEIVHHGGWGFQLGDEGSAAWLGRRALAAVLRIADGRDAPDPLAPVLEAACETHPVLFARDAAAGDFAALARVVLAHETPLARRLIADAGAEVAGALAGLGHREGEAWVLAGGMGEALIPHLPAPLRAGLRPALGRPLDGALSLARGLG